MKKPGILIPLFLTFSCLAPISLLAHSGPYSPGVPLRKWTIEGEDVPIYAFFKLYKDNAVFLETAGQEVLSYPFQAFSEKDQKLIIQRTREVAALNGHSSRKEAGSLDWRSIFVRHWRVLAALSVFLVALYFVGRKIRGFSYLWVYIVLCTGGVFLSFQPPIDTITDPGFIDSAFTPFKSKVKTRWDNQYFYVESLGLPSHPMMTGITSWQQQVPIPQCYVGSNAWSIPLNPVVAATPIPTATNFFRGAIGIAANGIPIFNAYNNTGADSYLIGELDQYGGHCGRADDYHYHIAPLSLDSATSDILPIAFALDGFAVYGGQEPNGEAMQTLDANHGHYFNGVYHYHGTLKYPYMVGSMVGVVTKDASDQIIPQATTKAIRPAGTPLRGAVITGHQANGSNGYTLTHTLNNQTYSINYSWTPTGTYTFNFVSPTETTTSTYNATAICTLTTGTTDIIRDDALIHIYPNPTSSGFYLELKDPLNIADVRDIALFDANGHLVFRMAAYQPHLVLPAMPKGIYFIKVRFAAAELTKRLMVQ